MDIEMVAIEQIPEGSLSEVEKDRKKGAKKKSKNKKDKKDKKKKSKKKEDVSCTVIEKEEAVPPKETRTEEPIGKVAYGKEELETTNTEAYYDDISNVKNEEDYFDKNTGDERKIFLSRIPANFDELSITRSLNEVFGEESVEHVALSQAKKDENGKDEFGENNEGDGKEHRGFAFVIMKSVEKRNEAIAMGTVRGKVKESSKKKHTLYIRPVVRDNVAMDDQISNKDVCFLWSKFRCPYGDLCKFKHVGEGGCDAKKEASKQKCFMFRTKGKCKLGDECPYSHDFVPKISAGKTMNTDVKDKDCINWKTKGKCRKGDKCPYRHDEAVRQAFLDKKEKKAEKKRKLEKKPQPLSVRVFGLNYDSTEEDVRNYFKHCGVIKEITFPIFEDSGRSKGYCGVLFVSPKATEKACELDGQELHGRWLSVQPGKMYLKKWEQMETDRKKDSERSTDDGEKLGEYGQKIKRRKKHGFKD